MAPYSIAALGIYVGLATLCTIAARARTAKNNPAARLTWMVISLCVVGILLFRIFGLEDAFRAYLRGLLRLNGAYERRREIQAPIAVLIGTVSLFAGWFIWLSREKFSVMGRWTILAVLGLLGLAVLMSLRILSLHGIDRVLYGGGLHINRIAECLFIAAIGFAAARHCRSNAR